MNQQTVGLQDWAIMPSGGRRPGSGRKPGAAWTKGKDYEKGVPFSCTLRPDLKRWLEARKQKTGVSMSKQVNDALENEKEREGNEQ